MAEPSRTDKSTAKGLYFNESNTVFSTYRPTNVQAEVNVPSRYNGIIQASGETETLSNCESSGNS